MMRFLKKSAAVLLAVLFLAGLAISMIIRAAVGTSVFRDLAQAKMGQMLHADVRVGKINISFLNRIVLSGLEINYRDAPASPDRSVTTQIPKVVFRYDLAQLLNRRLSTPSAVVFEKPMIVLGPAGASAGLDRLSEMASGLKGLSGLEVDGASLRFMVPGIDEQFGLNNLKGSVESAGKDKLRVNVRAWVTGPLEGGIRIAGEIDLRGHAHKLTLVLNRIGPARKTKLPIANLQGVVRIQGENILFDDLTAAVHGWRSVLSGRVARFQSSDPVYYLDGRFGKGPAQTRIVLTADLPQKRLTGSISPPEMKAVVFEGNIYREGALFIFDELKVDQRCVAWGKIDFGTGGYQVFAEKGRQRFSVVSNLKGAQLQMRFSLHHFKISGLDLVTEARVRLKPDGAWEEPRWKFQGTLHTDYFIVGGLPMNDFRANFELGPDGIKGFRGFWGHAVQVTGSLGPLGSKPRADLVADVVNFDLARVREFASEPLPKSLGGILDGRLRVAGDFSRPEVSGDFGIKKGSFGKLFYDRGIIHFRGFPPYLPLSDSKILKGRSSLALEGAIDLSLANVFHGIEVRSSDKIAQWKADTEYA